MLGSQLLLPSMDGGPRGPAEAVGMGLAYYELFKSLLRHLDTFGGSLRQYFGNPE